MHRTQHKHIRSSYVACLFAILALFSTASAGYSQAYCALRDPSRKINELIPGAQKWRSIVAEISADTRQSVSERLPFTLHTRELGSHTVYVVNDKDGHHHVVHVRSEASRWGMVEIVWSLDSLRQITGFRFQRCRNRNRDEFAQTRLAKALTNAASFERVRTMLDSSGKQLTPDARSMANGHEGLALVVVRSALKTMVATDLGWSEDLDTLAMDGLARRKLVAMTPLTVESIACATPTSGGWTSLRIAFARGEKGEHRGTIIAGSIGEANRAVRLVFALDPNDRIIAPMIGAGGTEWQRRLKSASRPTGTGSGSPSSGPTDVVAEQLWSELLRAKGEISAAAAPASGGRGE